MTYYVKKIDSETKMSLYTLKRVCVTRINELRIVYVKAMGGIGEISKWKII
jgi:hypothetical protein